MFLTEAFKYKSMARTTDMGFDQLTEAAMGFHIAYQNATMTAMVEEAQLVTGVLLNLAKVKVIKLLKL